MAFINPNMISSVSKEEFEELKNQVSKIETELNDVKSIVKSGYNVSGNITEEKNINFSSVNQDSPYIILDKDIKGAKLTGIPRIEYFDFSKKDNKVENIVEVNDVINTELDNIIDLSDVLDDKSYKFKLDSIPTIVKTSSGHRTTLMNKEKIEHMKNQYFNDSKVFKNTAA